MGEKFNYDIEMAKPKPGRSRWLPILLFATSLLVYLLGNFSAINTTFIEDPVDTILALLGQNYAAEWSKKYTAESHLPGTNYGLVEWTRDKFEEYGWKTTIDTYDIFVSYPESHSLSLLDEKARTIYNAPLKEDVIPEDPTTHGNDTIPTFLSYAANGNVTAQYIYANYGTVDDFKKLNELGVNITGKIAVIRYGKIFRGLKVKFAQENGAVGVLLYLDPGDDFGITPANGFKQYPHGPARQESSVQRGSVQFLGGIGAAPGDPTTPGWASKGNVSRVDPHVSIGRIPVLPISYREVTPILKRINGYGVASPDEWKGELKDFDYNIGPNPEAQLNLFSNQTFNITPLWNVYGEIEGKNKHEVIIIGNHRDAWIKGGAGDPNSGSSALIEVARALGDLKKSGYEFERTIILKSFDGEEYGLLGSTEFGELNADDLKRKVVAYINVDIAVDGKHLRIGASPLLNKLLRKVATWLPYPEGKSKTLYEHFVEDAGDRIGHLGSGSDYTVFLEHLGIPSVDLGFRPGKDDGIYHYHSNYDSYHWMSTFGDKGFVFHNLAAKYLSLLALELSKKKVFELSAGDYATSLFTYFEQLYSDVPKEWLNKEVPHHLRKQFESVSLMNEEFISKSTKNHFKLGCSDMMSWLKYSVKKPGKCPHQTTTFKDILDQTKQDLYDLSLAAVEFDAENDVLQDQYDHRSDYWPIKRYWLYLRILKRNKLLKFFERNFLYYEGLHERPWFKHMVFASGRFTGYTGQTWPGIREAVEDNDLPRAVKWLGIASKAARRASHTIRYSI